LAHWLFSDLGEGSEGKMEIKGSEINIRIDLFGAVEIIDETGKTVKLPPKHIIKIEGKDITEIHIYEGGRLLTVYGFPAKVKIEPYYG
jgi:hypothetical protein